MNDLFLTKMKRSLDFTLAGNPAEAMRVIQEALGRIPSTAPADLSPKSIAGPRPISPARARKRASGVIVEAVILADSPRTARTTSAPARARTKGDEGLVKRHHTSRYGARDYWIHVPADAANIRGLIVMLHGCNQTALDFARGTRMTAAAETAGFVTVWPEQARAHNSSECWNWFRGGDQAADSGEPAILADLARSVASEFSVPNGHVFAAGLSAGGAMAAILADTHPKLFGAVGVHSGLAPCSAQDVVSAFSAMRGTPSPLARPLSVPCIVFQGLADMTVTPANIQQITGPLKDTTMRLHEGVRRSTRVTSGQNQAGRPVEVWEVQGAGHAWAGGSHNGSFTDPSGPDASAEMVRFFVAQASRVLISGDLPANL